MKRDTTTFDIFIATLLMVIMLAAIFVWYKYPDDAAVAAICSGLVTSILVSFALLGVRSVRERLFDKVLVSTRATLSMVQALSAWHEGSWVEYMPTQNVSPDPSDFWFRKRLSTEECHHTLILIGRSHRFMFDQSSVADRSIMTDAIRRVLTDRGRVWLFFAEGAATLPRTITFLRDNLRKEVRSLIELRTITNNRPITYSCLMNDAGVWVAHRPVSLPDDRSYLAVIRRSATPYFYNLILSDAEATFPASTKIDLT
jgi:hypothetical protein